MGRNGEYMNSSPEECQVVSEDIWVVVQKFAK